MALSNIEKHYNKHPEDKRLLRRHGIVEFQTTMHHLHRFLKPGYQLLDIGAGTGRYTSALMAEGYDVKAVELVKRNINVFLEREPTANVVQGDARDMPFIPTDSSQHYSHQDNIPYPSYDKYNYPCPYQESTRYHLY